MIKDRWWWWLCNVPRPVMWPPFYPSSQRNTWPAKLTCYELHLHGCLTRERLSLPLRSSFLNVAASSKRTHMCLFDQLDIHLCLQVNTLSHSLSLSISISTHSNQLKRPFFKSWYKRGFIAERSVVATLFRSTPVFLIIIYAYKYFFEK